MSIFVSLLSPVGKVALYLENLNLLHPTMLCANFCWNWPIGCCFVNVFSLFPNYLLLEKGVTLYLNKFESLSSKDDLFQVWLNLALWFWKRRWKCEKFTDRRGDGRYAIRKAHLSFQHRRPKIPNMSHFVENTSNNCCIGCLLFPKIIHLVTSISPTKH